MGSDHTLSLSRGPCAPSCSFSRVGLAPSLSPSLAWVLRFSLSLSFARACGPCAPPPPSHVGSAPTSMLCTAGAVPLSPGHSLACDTTPVVNPSRATVIISIQFNPTYHLRTHLVRYSNIALCTLELREFSTNRPPLHRKHQLLAHTVLLLTFPENFNRRLLVFSSQHSSCLLLYTCTYSELSAHHFNSCSGLCKHFMGNSFMIHSIPGNLE